MGPEGPVHQGHPVQPGRLWHHPAGGFAAAGGAAHLAQTRGNDPSSTLLRDLLLGQVPAYKVPAHPENRTGHAAGILVGGNLCTFTPILGTTADATLGRDIILFIEEVEEDMSHIDRLINTLILNGVFERCRGIVLGEFTGCKANLDFDSVEEMICSYVPEGIPVLCGFLCAGGHSRPLRLPHRS